MWFDFLLGFSAGALAMFLTIIWFVETHIRH